MCGVHSRNSEDLERDGREHVTGDHGNHGDADSNAYDQAQRSVDLCQELIAHQLGDHLARIHGESQSSNWGRQERLHVSIVTSISQWLRLGLLTREDSEVEFDRNLCVAVFTLASEPESVGAFFGVELDGGACLFLILVHLAEQVVQLVGEDAGLLRQGDVVKQRLKIISPLTDVVVRLKEIAIPSLQNEEVVLARSLHVEQKTVVEGSLSVFAPVMAVCLLLVLVVNVGLDKDVTGSFDVFARNVFGVEHAETNLIVKHWLSSDIPDLLLLLLLFVLGLNFEPAGDHTL